MRFKNTTTGVEQDASPGTKRYAIFERSDLWRAVDKSGAEVDNPLELLTVTELRGLATDNGLEVPADARKSRLVEIVRDAGVQPAGESET
jgi:hypothetical protein